MATEHESTGRIVEASRDFCLLCASISGEEVTLSFNQRMFYNFGIRCEGNMANILSEGTEVNFSYIIDEPGTKPCVVVVWRGNKPGLSAAGVSGTCEIVETAERSFPSSVKQERPECSSFKQERSSRPTLSVVEKFHEESKALYSDPPLEGTFGPNRNGQKTFLQYKDLYVFVQACNFYIHGRRCKGKHEFRKVVHPGLRVNFEAVLKEYDPNRYMPGRLKFLNLTHDATCVWIGRKPSLDAVASSLPRTEWSLLKRTNTIFYGCVSRIYFPDIALVCMNNKHCTVIANLSSFGFSSGECLITDLVALGDCVKFKVGNDPNSTFFVHAVEVDIVSKTELRRKTRKRKLLDQADEPVMHVVKEEKTD